MKDFFRVFLLLAGVTILSVSSYLIFTNVSPVIIAYVGLACAVAIILYGIFFWKRGRP